ncbi:MAG: hypothetical protein A3H62_01080 [Candidatus Ryanbacteria bacterium RIFCSPLOWO2_02_FULL_44_40]|nr:MAG: hypothetical protein A3H62_01080 [Candidatus Ryanbacteria bacterium RIFCSPLOWO2_02_FULL_44_40]
MISDPFPSLSVTDDGALMTACGGCFGEQFEGLALVQVHPDSTAQLTLQPSPDLMFASSHVSPDSITPLPQTGEGMLRHWVVFSVQFA